jgi:hypothetical protein
MCAWGEALRERGECGWDVLGSIEEGLVRMLVGMKKNEAMI